MNGEMVGMVARQSACVTGAGTVWPGLFDPMDPARAMLFDASGQHLGDPMTQFYSRDVQAMDWLADFLLDDSLLDLRLDTGPSFEVEEDPDAENVYDRNALVTTESDPGWAS